jgi:putative FmdB family regulatory protein
MPFYEYQCNNCGHALEAMQKVSDPPLKKCPDCGKPQLQKLMSAPVFRLKGGGWYETDFKSDQDNKRNLADRPEDSPKEEKPKEEKKEGAVAASKDAPAADAPKTDKAAEKPAEKAPTADSAKKSAERSAPGRAGQTKSKLRKRPARAPIKRSTAKPARRR